MLLIIIALIVEFVQYIGNQAKQQLVKNAKNTITGFRNLIGKKCGDEHLPTATDVDATCTDSLRYHSLRRLLRRP